VKGICPNGWHLPSDAEWTQLIDYLGGESVAGSKLKETGTVHWTSPNTATNSSGFTALPGGYRGSNLTFNQIKNQGHWWSATGFDVDNSWKYALYNDNAGVDRYASYKQGGFSVRCVKD
jgi:uncharacterized protein (TIGR02145 family)